MGGGGKDPPRAHTHTHTHTGSRRRLQLRGAGGEEEPLLGGGALRWGLSPHSP